MSSITHRQRLETCLSGERPDRVPVSLWRHFPVDDQSPAAFATVVLNFQKHFDFDLVKFTPASSFCLKDWGSQDEWRGNTEGIRDYTREVIHHAEDWNRLKVLDPYQGYLGAQLEAIRILVKALGPDVPIIQTIFNPLSQAKNLVGKDRLLAHIQQYPDAVLDGLKIITESTRRFIEATLDTGIAGVFFAVQHAQYGLLTEQEYQTFGIPYDLQVLEPVEGFWFNMLHLHGEEVMFDYFLDYPVQAINWHDRDTLPSLRQARERFPGVLCGGLNRQETVTLGTPEAIYAEARDAIDQTDGLRFILGTGCVTPIIAPYGNILAVRQAVER